MTDASAAHRLVTLVTYTLLAAALVLGLLWFLRPNHARWEPAVNTLTLTAGLTGILLERYTASAERRREVLRAVADELADNKAILDHDEAFARTSGAGRRVYPRLNVSAVDQAVVSGVLNTSRDRELAKDLHRWRDLVVGLNWRLDLTEMRFFVGTPDDGDVDAFSKALHNDDGFLAETRKSIATLIELLEAKGVRAG